MRMSVTVREFRKLSILMESWCCCHGRALFTRFLTKASVTGSFQALATRFWTWASSGVSSPVRENRKLGFAVLIGETLKLISVEDHTFLSRRVCTLDGVKL